METAIELLSIYNDQTASTRALAFHSDEYFLGISGDRWVHSDYESSDKSNNSNSNNNSNNNNNNNKDSCCSCIMCAGCLGGIIFALLNPDTFCDFACNWIFDIL